MTGEVVTLQDTEPQDAEPVGTEDLVDAPADGAEAPVPADDVPAAADASAAGGTDDEAAESVDALDDELDDLHVSLTAELATGSMPVPVAIELAMIARFYERFGDHAVNLVRRMAALAGGGPEPGGAGTD